MTTDATHRIALCKTIPVYFILLLLFDWVSIHFSESAGISSWYPPIGLFLAFILYYGPRFLPVHLICFTLSSEWMWGDKIPFIVICLHAVTSGLLYTLGAMILNNWTQKAKGFRSARYVSLFMIIFGVTATISAVISIAQYTGMQIIPSTETTRSILSHAVGDVIGILVLTPLIMEFIFPKLESSGLHHDQHEPDRPPLSSLARFSDWIFPAIVTLGVLLYEFYAFKESQLHLSFILFAPLVYITVRHGTTGGILCIVFINLTMVAILANIEGGVDLVLQNQLLMIALSGTGLLLGSLVDEQQTMRKELQLSERRELVGRMAGNLAHDFNNFLTVINNHCNFIMQSPALQSDPDIKESLEAIQVAGSKSAAITTRLLSFSRFTDTPDVYLAVDPTIRQMLPLLRSISGENVSIIFDADSHDSTIRVGKGQFEQIMLNLVINAKDAIQDTGRITIETLLVSAMPNDPVLNTLSAADSYAEITIRDNGCGIPHDILDEIFEPFFTTKPVGKGTGLGLSSVRAMVEQADGTILVESEKNVGTSMKLYWPVSHEADATFHGELDVQEDPTAAGGGKVILIVEDEPSVQKVLSRILERKEFQVMSADSGEDAMEILNQSHQEIDLVLTDLIMPGMSGIELAETIKQQYPEMPVALMSGYADDDLIERGLDRDQFSLLRKPYTPAEVVKHIEKAIQNGTDRV